MTDDLRSLTKVRKRVFTQFQNRVFGQFHELARTRRQRRVEGLLRPGLRGHKRKAPSVLELKEELRKRAWNTIAASKTDDAEEKTPPRRERLVLRSGLNRVIPRCTVTDLHWERRPNHELEETKFRESQWTVIEGVPERWMEVFQPRRSSGFRFTPIEGVLERLIEPISASRPLRSPQRKLSVLTDVEGVPERQWIFPPLPAPQAMPAKSGTPVLDHVGTSCVEISPQGQDAIIEEQDPFYKEQETVNQEQDPESEEQDILYEEQDLVDEEQDMFYEEQDLVEEEEDRIPSPVEVPGSVLKTYAHAFEIPEIEFLDSPAPSHGRISHSLISISDQEEEFQDRISIDEDMEISSEIKSSNQAAAKRTEDAGRSSLLGLPQTHTSLNKPPRLDSDVGTHWVNGCRRSQRNRCKPLRYREDEHEVYERNYNSKCFSTPMVYLHFL